MFENKLYEMPSDEFKVPYWSFPELLQSALYGTWVPGFFDFDIYSPLLTQSNVNALIEMKLEKHKNLREESGFYWREVSDGTFKFDRREREVLNWVYLCKLYFGYMKPYIFFLYPQ